MTLPAGRWDDLATRIGSGGAVAVVGLAAVWAGGLWFLALAAAVGGVMVWELARMLDAEAPALALAIGAGVALAVAGVVPAGFGLPLLMLPSILGFALIDRRKATFGIYTLMIVLAAWGLFALRQEHGFLWLGWLVSVVIVTDIAGYFAGRLIGGPRFWPRVSPKKTWSGTVAGWIGAALVGLAFASATEADLQLIGISIAASMASQIGDIAESAVKRRVGVKDSSALLPGHGGLMDRFDGMLGASIFLLLVAEVVGFPPGTA
jgi:phosphatidate cytidylyltransferase